MIPFRLIDRKSPDPVRFRADPWFWPGVVMTIAVGLLAMLLVS